MKSPDSITYAENSSVINTNIEKLVKRNFSPGGFDTPYKVVIPVRETRNSKGIFKMIMGVVYFVSLVYFLGKLLTWERIYKIIEKAGALTYLLFSF